MLCLRILCFVTYPILIIHEFFFFNSNLLFLFYVRVSYFLCLHLSEFSLYVPSSCIYEMSVTNTANA